MLNDGEQSKICCFIARDVESALVVSASHPWAHIWGLLPSQLVKPQRWTWLSFTLGIFHLYLTSPVHGKVLSKCHPKQEFLDLLERDQRNS